MPKYMTVIKINPDKTRSFEQIDLLEIDFIESTRNDFIYYIGNEKYYQITKKTQIEEMLRSEGFDSLDRPNYVNLKKIRKFDAKYGKVYFVENPDENSAYASVAKIKYSFVEKLINRIVSYNNDTTQTVKSDKKDLKSIVKGLLNKT